MKQLIFYRALTILIAMIWLVNGLICKVLNLVPRHEEIVSQILIADHSRTLTILLGVSEIIMAVWVLSRWKSKLNALIQILVISTMNILEIILVPELLLWGRWNAFFALMLILIIYFNEFVLGQKSRQKALV